MSACSVIYDPQIDISSPKYSFYVNSEMFPISAISVIKTVVDLSADRAEKPGAIFFLEPFRVARTCFLVLFLPNANLFIIFYILTISDVSRAQYMVTTFNADV